MLALVSAVLFGAMAATLGIAFRRSSDAEAGALVTALVALVVTGVLSLGSDFEGGLWPFLLTGLIAPGGSQVLYVRGVKEVGASRSSVIVGAGPARVGHDRSADSRRAVRAGARGGRGAHSARRRRTRRRTRPAGAPAARRSGSRSRIDALLRHARQHRSLAGRRHHRRSAARSDRDDPHRRAGDGHVSPHAERARHALGGAAGVSAVSRCPVCSGACPTPHSSKPSTAGA